MLSAITEEPSAASIIFEGGEDSFSTCNSTLPNGPVDIYEDDDDDVEESNDGDTTNANYEDIDTNIDTDMAVASQSEQYPRWTKDENLGRERAPQCYLEEAEEDVDDWNDNANPSKKRVRRPSSPFVLHSKKNNDIKKVAPTAEDSKETKLSQSQRTSKAELAAATSVYPNKSKTVQNSNSSSKRRRRRKKRTLDWNLAIILIAVFLIIAAAVVGTIFGLKSRDSTQSNTTDITFAEDGETFWPSYTDGPTNAPTEESTQDGPTNAPSATDLLNNNNNTATIEAAMESFSPTASPSISPSAAPTTCNPVIKPFPDLTRITIVMQVSSTISPMEMEYSANVFRKTFNSLATCDSLCRELQSTQVVNQEIMQSTGSTTADQNSPDCDSLLELTLELEGTYRGCEQDQNDQTFPGMFPTKQMVVDPPPGRRKMLRTDQKQTTRRRLQDTMLCPSAVGSAMAASCPSETGTTGPDDDETTEERTIRTMNQFLTMLPKVCRIESAHDVPRN
ncbi:hypothetical protein IV203_004570 [Nitzschia inconspicua]|uniref:Uncharacterized protein n=1 Tax=Nitzschia inconspicua TaxID=303405 RepID=A0A9K3PS00_9STRA|nr:hypothetical protein IV203_004570 [Nitzschia inconspicua]